MDQEKNILEFNKDVQDNQGYRYTRTDRLSCHLANQRLSRIVTDMVSLENKRVIDVGCGDGTYTMEFLAQSPAYVLGVDAAKTAIDSAMKESVGSKNIEFRVMSAYDLDHIGEKFDVAVVRGLLHHLYDAKDAIASVSRVADEAIIIEPNGYNPVLKVIERVSRYHRQHEEKSFAPPRLDRWIKDCGGRILKSAYCGLVPFFCPDVMARLLKATEPLVESLPLVRASSCAVYVVKVRFDRV